MSSIGRIHARVSGRVQGVGFRWTARSRAQSAGLSGWVTNTDDGSVELEVQGDEAALAAFVEWLRDGPIDAVVDVVDTEPLAPIADAVDSFDIV